MSLIAVAVLLSCAAGTWYGGRKLLRGELPRWWSDALDKKPAWLVALFALPVLALVVFGITVIWFALTGSPSL